MNDLLKTIYPHTDPQYNALERIEAIEKRQQKDIQTLITLAEQQAQQISRLIAAMKELI